MSYKDKEKQKEAIRKWNKEHRELMNQRTREWRQRNPDTVKEYNQQWYSKHKDSEIQRSKKWKLENKDKANQRTRQRTKTDSQFRLSRNLRKRIVKALRGISKSKHTVELLGCSIEFLKSYLESQFAEGMTWSNYGVHGWHVDHIMPCDSFDLTKPEEQAKCFHYTNLQPLWAEDNLSKGSSIPSH